MDEQLTKGQIRYRNHRESRLTLNKDCVRRKREALYELLGGQFCQCCGESNFPFLTIDHVNGGGTAHRKSLTSNSGYYGTMLKDPDALNKYQVLCFNCNYGKARNKGICPHQKEKDHRLG